MIPIIGNIIDSVGKYFTNRQTIKAAERERNDILKDKALESKLLAIQNGQQADIEMDTNGRNVKGWMDDASFAIFLTPVILAFFPSMVDHVEAGFKVIENMPVWYQYTLAGMLISVWGYRRLVTPIVEILVKNWVNKFPGGK